MTTNRRELLLKRHSRIKLLAFLALITLTVVLVLKVENMLVASLLAFVISYLIGPLVNYLERAGIDRVLATVGVFVFIGLLFTALGTWLAPLIGEQLAVLQADSGKYIQGVIRLLDDFNRKLSSLTGNQLKFNISEHLQARLEPFTQSFFAALPDFLRSFFTTMLLAPFFAFFMIKDGRQNSRSLLALVPNNIFELTYNLYHQINDQMGHFIRARLMEAVIVGLVTWVGLFAIDFPFAALLAVFAAVTNLIPYVGPVIGTVPAVIVAVVNGASAVDMSLLLLVYFIAQLIDAVVIIPLVVAKIVDLHPVSVVVAIIVGAQMMGVIGMLISIPVASVLKVTVGTVFRHLTDYRV